MPIDPSRSLHDAVDQPKAVTSPAISVSLPATATSRQLQGAGWGVSRPTLSSPFETVLMFATSMPAAPADAPLSDRGRHQLLVLQGLFEQSALDQAEAAIENGLLPNLPQQRTTGAETR